VVLAQLLASEGVAGWEFFPCTIIMGVHRGDTRSTGGMVADCNDILLVALVLARLVRSRAPALVVSRVICLLIQQVSTVARDLLNFALCDFRVLCRRRSMSDRH
jgi:hypothetical protein